MTHESGAERRSTSEAGSRPHEEGERTPADHPKTQREMLHEQIWTAVDQLERPADGLLISGFSGGLDLGFSVFFMAVAFTMFGAGHEDPLMRLLGANLYSVGFIFVILGRSELFTEHTTLAAFPVLDGRASVRQLARLWGLVYVSNVSGALVAAFITALIGPSLGSIDPVHLIDLAASLLDHSGRVMLLSAILAGWLMGLLSWLLASAQGTMSRIVFVWIVTSMIGLAGLHHCIAGTVEVAAGVIASDALRWADFGRFLFWATAGNAVGGVLFVSLLKYGHAVRAGRSPPVPFPLR